MNSNIENGTDSHHESAFSAPNSHVSIHLNTQNSNFSIHRHFSLEIILPVENNYTAFVNNGEIFMNSGDILLIAPNTYHSYSAPTSGSRFFYLIDLSVLESIRGFVQIERLLKTYILITPENFPESYTRIRDILTEINMIYNKPEVITFPSSESSAGTSATADLSELLIYTRLSEMILLIAKHFSVTATRKADIFAKGKKQEYLARFTSICNYIDSHCCEYLTLEEIADHASFSKFHFSRLFKEFTGESFYRYVNRKRMEHACELLVSQNLTITEIGLASGYSSNSIFIRMFKQFYNCTPKEYRSQHLRQDDPHLR